MAASQLITTRLRRDGLIVRCHRVTKPDELKTAVQDGIWDVVVAGPSLWKRAFKETRTFLHTRRPDLPLILLARNPGTRRTIKRLKDGVWDVVSKNDLARLTPAIVRGLREATGRHARDAAETALRASEAKYRDLFENSRDAIGLVDLPSGTFTSGNTAALKMFGVKNASSFASFNPATLSPELQPDGRSSAEVIREMNDMALSEGFLVFEWTHRRLNGAEFLAEVLLTRVEQQGKVMLQATIRDITERKRVEATSRRNEEDFRAMFEGASVGIVQTDTHLGRFLRVNPKMCEITGYSAGELLQMRVRDINHPDDRDRDWKLYQQVVHGKVPSYRTEKRYVRKDGALAWVNVNMTVILDANGLPMRTMATVEDISERKRAEVALQESENKYRSLFESSRDAILILEPPSWKFASANPAAAKMFGASDEKGLLSFSPWRLSPRRQPDGRSSAQKSREWVETAMREGSCLFEWTHRRTNGETFPVDVLLTRTEQRGRTVLQATVRDITERKRAEEALREREQKFRAISESAQDAMIVIDDRGAITLWNSAAERILGYSAAEAVGKNFHEGLTATRHRDRHKTAFARFRASEEGIVTGKTLELVAVRKDGREVPVELSLSAFPLSGRWHACGIVRDITERKRMEERLRKVAEVQSALHKPGTLVEKLKRITDGVVDIFDADFARIWLLRPADQCQSGCIHTTTTDELHRCRQRHRCLHTVASSGRYIHQYDKDYNRVPLGCYRIGQIATGQDSSFLVNDVARNPVAYDHEWARLLGLVSFAGYQLRAPDGEALGVLAFFSKHVVSSEEDALLRSLSHLIVPVIQAAQAEEERARLVTAMEQAGETILITDTEHVILYVNPAFEKTTGYSRQEALGQTPRILKSGRHDVAFYNQMQETIARGELWQGRLFNKRKDGTIIEEDVTISPVRDAAGQIVNYVAVQRDVTQESMLKTQLRIAQKLEAVGQLAAGIAHEINTPTQYIGDNNRFLQEAFTDLGRLFEQHEHLRQAVQSGTATSGQAEELGRAADNANLSYLLQEVPKAIEQSLEGVDRVTRIVQAMKEFSHPGSEAKTLVDLNRAIQSTLMVSRNEWKYVANMVADLDPALPRVPCFPGEFNQVILNLIVNAAHAISDVVRATGGGKGTITVRTRHVADWVEIHIQDTGTGIPETVRHRVFDPFFTTKPVGKGTGQGLSIARSVIVDKHGGTLHFESEMGQGTTFFIRLPLTPPSSPEKHN